MMMALRRTSTPVTPMVNKIAERIMKYEVGIILFTANYFRLLFFSQHNRPNHRGQQQNRSHFKREKIVGKKLSADLQRTAEGLDGFRLKRVGRWTQPSRYQRVTRHAE